MMPTRFKCIVSSCSSSGKKVERKNIILHSFPKDQKTLAQWIKNIEPHLPCETLKDWMKKSSNRICSLHFKNGIKVGDINVPTVFEKKETENDGGNEIVAESLEIPMAIDNDNESLDEQESKQECNEIDCSARNGKPSEENVNDTEDNNMKCTAEKLSERNVADGSSQEVVEEHSAEKKNLSEDASFMITSRKCHDMPSQKNDREKAISEETIKAIRRFSIENIKDDDDKVRRHTNLPDYETFIALYNFVRPKDGFQLNYKNNKKDNVTRDASAFRKGRPRTLSDIDELFLTLCRLRKGLHEDDLAERFCISITSVSEIFLTWIDRLDCCLTSFDQIPGLDDRLAALHPESFKGFEDVDLIIDCTEIFTERPSDPVAQSALWSEYKSHNTGKVLIALSPIGYPRFISDVFPGSISDDEITLQSGILSLARRNKRWLADKGWQIDGDKYGLIIETPDRLQGKAQFSEAEDMSNRRISRLRIHVERLIRRIKVNQILDSIPIRYINISSKIVKVCARLTAFLPPLIKDLDSNSKYDP